MDWLGDTAAWYGVLMLMTWGVAPWVRLLCPALADGGAAIARPLALLAVVYPSWLVASLDLAAYATGGLWATLAILAAVGWLALLRRGAVDRRWLRSLLVAELVALVTFVCYVGVRGYSPQVLNTEKPMDLAFLASSARTDSVPPPDPWYAGEPINYYYLGYFLHGAVTRMAAIPASVGFNLALATTFSMAVVAAAGVGYDLARRWVSARRAVVAAALAAVLVVLAGNLKAPLELVRDPSTTVNADWWFGIGWGSSRIVTDEILQPDGTTAVVETINEFPAFSFVLGDLHPHVMALPFTIVALALAAGLFLPAGSCLSGRGGLVRIASTGAVVGALYALNSWDYPTYLVVAVAALWFGARRTSALRDRLVSSALLAVASLAAWAPFYAAFAPPVERGNEVPGWLADLPLVSTVVQTLGAVSVRTSAGEFLTVFGIPYVFALWFLTMGLIGAGREAAPVATQSLLIAAIGVTLIGITLAAPMVVLCGLPLAVAVEALSRDRDQSLRTVATALYGLGFALLLVTEFFFIQDVFGNRMNTLFKVYYQVWTLFGVATALAVVALWRDARLRRGAARRLTRPVLAGTVAAALLAGLAYPAISAFQYTDVYGPRDWEGVDGIAYVGETDPDQLAALRWLSDHAGRSDVILEAEGCPYQPWGEVPSSHVSAFTGVPTIMGWDNHENQWRAGEPLLRDQIDERRRAGEELFGDLDPRVLDRYGVTLLFVGLYERDGYDVSGCEGGAYPAVDDPSFPGPGWDRAFGQGDVAIYRRTGTGTSATAGS